MEEQRYSEFSLELERSKVVTRRQVCVRLVE